MQSRVNSAAIQKTIKQDGSANLPGGVSEILSTNVST